MVGLSERYIPGKRFAKTTSAIGAVVLGASILLGQNPETSRAQNPSFEPSAQPTQDVITALASPFPVDPLATCEKIKVIQAATTVSQLEIKNPTASVVPSPEASVVPSQTPAPTPFPELISGQDFLAEIQQKVKKPAKLDDIAQCVIEIVNNNPSAVSAFVNYADTPENTTLRCQQGMPTDEKRDLINSREMGCEDTGYGLLLSYSSTKDPVYYETFKAWSHAVIGEKTLPNSFDNAYRKAMLDFYFGINPN